MVDCNVIQSFQNVKIIIWTVNFLSLIIIQRLTKGAKFLAQLNDISVNNPSDSLPISVSLLFVVVGLIDFHIANFYTLALRITKTA